MSGNNPFGDINPFGCVQGLISSTNVIALVPPADSPKLVLVRSGPNLERNEPNVNQPAVGVAVASNAPVKTDGLEDYNPFSGQNKPRSDNDQSQPPIVNASTANGNFSNPNFREAPQKSLPGQEALVRQQQELERKEAELREREARLESQTGGEHQANWPPLPKFCPIKPLFYQDINVEIPSQFQRLVRIGHIVWLCYFATITINVLGSLVRFIASKYAMQFAISIVHFFLFTPLSLFLWYRPLYKAFRSDSSFSFMVFFFVLAAQIVVTGIQALGIEGFGTCGWINAITEASENTGVGILMFIVAAAYTACGLAMTFLLLRVHAVYRGTGASFAKAQQEFYSNRNVQNAAAGVAGAAISNQFSGQQNRY